MRIVWSFFPLSCGWRHHVGRVVGVVLLFGRGHCCCMLLCPNHPIKFKHCGERGLCLVSKIFVGRLPWSDRVERFGRVMGGSWVVRSGHCLEVLLT